MPTAGVTSEDIRRGLEHLGLGRGMKLMVHSSLRSFGWVEGGAEAVIQALMDLVGPEGLLLFPTFNHGRPFLEGGEGIFDPLTTPTSNGRIPDTFWRLPGVYRSLNPTHPFAAWGRDAARYTQNHHLTLTMGEDSPLGLLAREGGMQVHLGTTYACATAKHVAETMNRSPCLGYRTEAYPVRLPSGEVVLHRTWSWRERSCPLTESGELLEAGMEARGLHRRGKIGECTVTVFKLWDLLEVVWDLLDRGHGGFPPCARCSIRPRVVATTVPSDWPPEQLQLGAGRKRIGKGPGTAERERSAPAATG
jgi:aminoglycoside 3-N-acetyltransferase